MEENKILNTPWDEYPTEYINITNEQLNNLLSVEYVMDIYNNFRDRWNCISDLSGEVWVPIEGFDNLYSISCYGRLRENYITYLKKDTNGVIQRKFSRLRIINGYNLDRNNYPIHIFNVNGKNHHITIHKLVATHFIKKANESFDYIDHKNTIKTCAHIFNLWWCNAKLNGLNPITRRYLSKKITVQYKYPTPDKNASPKDNIENFIDIDNIFAPRMMTDIDFNGEEWRYLYLYNIYVSNYGRIKKFIESDNKYKILKQTLSKTNYLNISINNSTISSHYLVLYAFGIIKHIHRYENDMNIDHINTKTYDNRLNNLRYVTLKDNVSNPLTRKNMSDNYNKEIRQTNLLFYYADSKKFYREFCSIKEASIILNISSTTIFNYIEKNKPMQNKWYIIEKTKNTIDEYITIKVPENEQKKKIELYKWKVNKYDNCGNFIEQFDSCKSAAEKINRTSSSINLHINSYSRETKEGCYYRYTLNPENKLNLWESGLFNGSENAQHIQQLSRHNVNIIKKTHEIIDVYDIFDGVIIKRYYSKELCSEELNTTKENIFDNSVVNEQYIIKIRNYSSDVDIVIDNPNLKNKIDIQFSEEEQNYIKTREIKASSNNIVVYNYYTKQEIGTYDIKTASEVTGIDKIAIINCCENEYKSFVNIKTFEEYAFCYESEKDTFDIEYDENLNTEIYALYHIVSKSLVKIFYSKYELSLFIGYSVNINSNLLGEYILKIYAPGDDIPKETELPKKIYYNQYNTIIYPKILKFDLNGKYIETYDNISCLKVTKTAKNKIRDCMKRTLKSAYGFQWRYEYDCNGTEDIEPVIHQSKHIHNKVDAYTENGEYIKTFENITEAAKYFNINSNKVSFCCHNMQKNCISKREPYNKIHFKFNNSN